MPVFGGDNADSYFDEGVTAAMKGDLNRSIEFFEKCIRLDSSNSGAYHQLGKVYTRLGRFPKAIAFLSQVASAKPKLLAARIDLAYAHLGEGNLKQAQDLFVTAATEKPDNVRARLGMAYCAYQEQQYDAALLMAQDIADTSGANFGVLYLLARSAKAAGRPDLLPEAIGRADALIEKSLQSSEDHAAGYYFRGLLYTLKKDLEKAEENFALAVEKADPSQHYSAYEEHFALPDMLAQLARTREARGQDASAEWDNLRAIDPESPLLPGPAQE
ncbi:MAG: tetratricopeptide repeat protein [Candidatus Hydrogenedens sp.]|nr:tetratricopeptide repeat protein [Candidatus Hydrogenedens sp.]